MTSPKASGSLGGQGKGRKLTTGNKLGKISKKSPFGGNSAKKLKKFPRKPSFLSRIKKKISFGASKLKNKISNSFIGKTYRAVVKTVKFVFKVIKGVAKAVIATVVFAWKATKFVAKTFYKAAKFTGKVAKGAIKGAISLGKKAVKIVKAGGAKALAVAVMSFTPGAFVGKLGWRAIKFVGKSIWKGIKTLALKTVGFFKSLFGLAGKFVNKVAHWIGVLGKGIVDKTYRFLVKPLASLMVTIFNFVSSVVLSPIQFIKWLIPAVVDKIMGVIHNISQAVKRVLKSTYSIFKRILMNPITIAILVGGLFFLLAKWLLPKLSGGIQGIKDNILKPIVSIAKTALGFLTGLGSVLFTVGKWIFKAIDYLTNPKGPIAKFLVTAFQLFLTFKRELKKLMAATGRNSVDILCMFLAGDWIGIALHVIAGKLVQIWDYLKRKPFMRKIIGMIMTLADFGKLFWNYVTVVPKMLKGFAKAIFSGNLKGVFPALTKPWKDLWGSIKDLFSGKAYKRATTEIVFDNPVEANEEKAKSAVIAVRSLNMVGSGKAESNLKYWQRYQDMIGQARYGDLLPRIQRMNKLYQENSSQVNTYDEFISKTWEIGKVGDDAAQQVMKALLESSDLSQKLLSVMFYYNPQTGDT